MNILLESNRFKKCFYQKTGTGFPIVLLHGFGANGQIFKYQIASLSKHYQVIVPDLPGSGLSALGTETMSMELLADYVHEIVLQERWEQFILLGHSMGGYATLAYAEKYEHYLLAYGLIHSSAYADDELKKENRRKSIRLIRNEGKETFLRAMIPNLYSPQSLADLPSEVAFHLTLALQLSSDSLVAYYEAMIQRPDRTSILRNNKLPVLFVIGKEDNAIPYQDILAQSTLPDISCIEMLENIGHTSMLECHERLDSIINNFCIYVLDSKIA
ncbi:MAG: alpha/beta hydrolase [Bacteroidetes bacterium]|nr:alpha/beta hydrolase [Bacteroidota bacterium]MBK8144795.1 alpha/beta hydrolase [Bacteroidota bacterium]MBP6315445.1 alpha/beta hydrolase [Chitinophagaceae bacterium]